MKVKDLKLINFRNYEEVYIELNKNINVFLGKNAQGKTNIIEAIYMCSKGSSFRTNRDNELINFNKDKAYIGSNVEINNYDRLIEIGLDRNQPKSIRINKTLLETQKELNSGLNIVVFSPEDLKIVKEGPANRRDFIDKSISQIKPVYSHSLSKYNKILYQRNSILKSKRHKEAEEIKNLLYGFDLQLVKIGSNILMERSSYIRNLERVAKNLHYTISEGRENLELEYSTNLPIMDSREETEKAYYDLLVKNITRDLHYGRSGIGPHRDDLIIKLNGNSARVYGSQGQQRSIVLSLKISEVEILKEIRRSYPVLLLDDVYSELDLSRRKYLSRLFENIQTFITLSNSESLESIGNLDKSIYYIENGKIIDRG